MVRCCLDWFVFFCLLVGLVNWCVVFFILWLVVVWFGAYFLFVSLIVWLLLLVHLTYVMSLTFGKKLGIDSVRPQRPWDAR